VRLHWGVGPEADAQRVAAGVWAAPIVHLGQRYASAAIVDGDPGLPSVTDLAQCLDGSPGSRVPHVWCDPDRSVSTLDLVGPGWTLLTGPDAAGWPGTAADLAVHRVTAPGWVEAAGITAGGALLVRPDGIVAWRAVTAPTDPAELGRVFEGLLQRATVQR
jgi:putative polyketide hydroxylase